MRTPLFTTLFVLAITSAVAAPPSQPKEKFPSAEELITKSDRARGGLSTGMSWDVKIATIQDGETSETEFQVKVKDQNVLAVCAAPVRQKGETYLFNARSLWVYRSNLRKPISVSTRQRLSGQTANGDIATTNYAKDYTAEVLKVETLENKPVYRLLLKAKSKDLTYDQIHYWISKDTGLAVAAEFLTLDGKPFKRAVYSYNHKLKLNGKVTPFISDMTIIESAFPKNKSTLKYVNMKLEPLNDAVFNVNNLSR